jgi:protein-tyrosine phosphatase
MSYVLGRAWKAPGIVASRLVKFGLRQTWLWLYEKVERIWNGVSPVETTRVRPHLYVGGQHYKRGLKAMRDMGIGATVSLREEADDAVRGVALERHLWLPTPDDHAPTLEQLAQGVAFIREAVKDGQGVYVHCGQGAGRAPTLAAAYLISEGHSPESALAEIRKVRPFITPTREQLRRLAEWAEVMNNRTMNNQ